MRTLFRSLWIPFVILMLARGAGAAGAVAGRIESVSVLAAGEGSSLAVRTTGAPALVAATAADERTVVVELVGIAADRRDMTVSDASRMISRIAIDTTGSAGAGIITRIRVSLGMPYRHRMRLSGNLVYVDFERVALPVPKPAASRPQDAAGRPAQVPGPKDSGPPAISETSGAPALRPRADATPKALPARAPTATAEVNLLSRWLAVTEPLQHTFNPPSAKTVLGRSWMPLVLKNGTTVFSYGDYAEVEDQLTFLLPFDDSDRPRVEAVSLPRSAVDLEATARASESVRAARYVLTSGPREFAELSREVSTVLDSVPQQTDPKARVTLVEGVRRRLIEWPYAHYGYRAADVSDAISRLDPILIQLRAAAGVNYIDVSLVAPPRAPAPTLTFRPPTLVDLIENAMRLVSLLNVPAERTAVLRTTAAALERHRVELPAVWLATGQRRVATALRSETRIDEAYRQLSEDVITSAVRAAAQGNVTAISGLQSDFLERDRRLGGKRQDVVLSTLAALRTQYDLAAQTQLSRERRTMGVEAVRAYATDIDPALKRFAELRSDLQQFDRSVTAPTRLTELRDAMEFVKRTLLKATPPPQVVDAHGLLLTAVYLAGVAVQDSVDPRVTGEMANSMRSSAAAEAIGMFDRGRHAIDAALRGK